MVYAICQCGGIRLATILVSARRHTGKPDCSRYIKSHGPPIKFNNISLAAYPRSEPNPVFVYKDLAMQRRNISESGCYKRAKKQTSS